MPAWLGWELEAVSSALTQPEGTQQTLHAKHVLAEMWALLHHGHCISEPHVLKRSARANAVHLEQDQNYLVGWLPNSIEVPCGAALFEASKWWCEDPFWGLKLTAMLMRSSATIHEFFLTHPGAVSCNDHQVSLHWFIREGMDGAEFTKVDNGMMIWWC